MGQFRRWILLNIPNYHIQVKKNSKSSIISEEGSVVVSLFSFWSDWIEKVWQRQLRKMRGMQTGVAEGDAIQMRFDPRQAGEYVVSSPMGALPRVYSKILQDVYSIWANKLSFFLPRERTLPVMSAEIKRGSQICWRTLNVFDLQSGSLRKHFIWNIFALKHKHLGGTELRSTWFNGSKREKTKTGKLLSAHCIMLLSPTQLHLDFSAEYVWECVQPSKQIIMNSQEKRN